MEEALEYQATWAAFALQSKVPITTTLLLHVSARLIDARVLQDLSESAAATKRKQKITYDNLGESPRYKAKL